MWSEASLELTFGNIVVMQCTSFIFFVCNILSSFKSCVYGGSET